MPGLRSDSHHLHRKDVPHLSESVWIGIERWHFVESAVNQFEIFLTTPVLFDGERFSRVQANGEAAYSRGLPPVVRAFATK
jgi:hypothetical protein